MLLGEVNIFCLFDLDVIGDTVLKASPLKIQEEPMEKGYITLMLT